MALKPDKAFLYIIIIFLLCVGIYVFYQYRMVYRETEEMWKTVISGFTEEKNEHLTNKFFLNVSDFQSIQSLNWHYFKSLIDDDVSLKRFNLAQMNVYDINHELRYSYTRDLSKTIIPNDQLLEKIQSNIRRNDTDVIFKKYEKNNLGIVTTPLKRRNNMHFLSIVYVFDMNQTRLQNIRFFETIVVGLTMFALYFLSIFFLRCVIKRNMDDISKYIDFCIIEKNKPNPYTLSYVPPFTNMAQKISYLISRKNELEKKYLEYSDKFYHFINLTSEGLVMEDEIGYIYFCNKRFAEILDYETESELLGLKMTDLFYDPEDTETYKSGLNISHISIQASNKVNFVTKNGMKKEVVLSKKAILNNQNLVLGFYCSITEVIGVSTFNYSQSEIHNLRSNVYERYGNPCVILDHNDRVVDVNEAFLNFVNKNRSSLISQYFIDTIKGFEFERSWHPNLRDFELFEPTVNKWFQVVIKNILVHNNSYKFVHCLIIDQFKKQDKYKKMILEDFRGFFFITGKNAVVLYVSQSFTTITHNSEEWFVSYYSDLINSSLNKSQNLTDTITISHRKIKYEFKIAQLFTNNDDMKLFQAILK